MATLSNQLATFRARHSLTLEDASPILGLSRATISRVENGASVRKTTAAQARRAMRNYNDAQQAAAAQSAATGDYSIALAQRFIRRVANNPALPEELRAEARLVLDLPS